MNKKARSGMILALSFLNMHEEEQPLSKDHSHIRDMLTTIVSKWQSKKFDIQKSVTVAWKKFSSLVDTEYEVNTLAFAFNLILKNPDIKKHRTLSTLTLEAQKMFMFKTEQNIVQSKQIVNRFYSKG